MMRRLLTYVSPLLLLAACSSEPQAIKTRSQLIEEGVEKRLSMLQARKMEDCKEELLTQVLTDVDSTIASQLKLDFIDTIAFPRRPNRPRIPGGKIVLDTSPVTKVISD